MKIKTIIRCGAIAAGVWLAGVSYAETLYYTGLTYDPAYPVYIFDKNNSVAWKNADGTNVLPSTSGDSLVIDLEHLDSTATAGAYKLGVIPKTTTTEFSYSFDSLYYSNYDTATKSLGTNPIVSFILSGATAYNLNANASIKTINVASGNLSLTSRGFFTTKLYSHDLNINVVNDIVLGASKPEGYVKDYDLAGNLVIGGTDRYYSNVGEATPAKSLSIGGNVIIGGDSNFKLNVGYSNYGASYDLNNPDTIINGVVVGYNGQYYDSTTGEAKTNTLKTTSDISSFVLSNGNSTTTA